MENNLSSKIDTLLKSFVGKPNNEETREEIEEAILALIEDELNNYEIIPSYRL